MKNLLKVKIAIIMVACLGLLFFSCKKEKFVNSVKTEKNENNVLKTISYSGGYPVYQVDPSIVAYFEHYCQRDAGPWYTNTPYDAESCITDAQAKAACGPTSYMMAAACLAGYNDPSTSYTSSCSKLASIVSVMGTPTDLLDISNYANSYDGGWINASYNTTEKTDRELTKSFIKNALGQNKFVIVAINAYTSNYNVVNNLNLYNLYASPDMNPDSDVITGSNSNRNYISNFDEGGSGLTKKSGHIIVLVKFVQTAADGTGYIEYIDPLAQTREPYGTSNRKYVSFTRLLNSMKYNGASLNYDATSVGLD